MAAMGSANWSWQLQTAIESVNIRYRVVSGHFFDLLGARAALGRTLRPEDDQRGSPRTVVLSHGFWQRQFSGDPGVIGRALMLSETAFTVVGVMPAAFRYPAGADVWTPVLPELAAIATSIPNLPSDGGNVGIFYMVGRLKGGATADAARLELDRIIAQTLAGRQRDVNRASVRCSIPFCLVSRGCPHALPRVANLESYLRQRCGVDAGARVRPLPRVPSSRLGDRV
jgi:hypothetical protein